MKNKLIGLTVALLILQAAFVAAIYYGSCVL